MHKKGFNDINYIIEDDRSFAKFINKFFEGYLEKLTRTMEQIRLEEHISLENEIMAEEDLL